jgi:cytidylate kinase
MIIELIGPAGAGKSTLSKALSGWYVNINLVSPPYFRNIEDVPFYVRNSLSVFPFLSQVFFNNGKLPLRDHFVFILLLNGWFQLLNQKAQKEDSYIVLDKGPVYFLMMLNMFGSDWLKSNSTKQWWDYIYHQWAETLDLVIWLDTALPILVDRVRGRENWHSVKDRPDHDAYQHLESYRQVYEAVISRLAACSKKFKVLHVDTGKYSLLETVDVVLEQLSRAS